MNAHELRLFLRALKEEGIGEVYLPAGPSVNNAEAGDSASPPAPPGSEPLPAESNQTSSPSREALLELRKTCLSCTQCPELAATRKSVVFGAGNAQADLVFVGEAPGREEDEQGLPFVGPAGQLLTKIIQAIGYERQQVFICNVLKCRPPGNRSPNPEEILNCQPYLKEQLRLIRPKMICALGNVAAQALLQTNQSMAQLRGKFYEYEGIKMICTYHPAYLLRNPQDKRKVWEDMKMMKRELEAMAS